MPSKPLKHKDEPIDTSKYDDADPSADSHGAQAYVPDASTSFGGDAIAGNRDLISSEGTHKDADGNDVSSDAAFTKKLADFKRSQATPEPTRKSQAMELQDLLGQYDAAVKKRDSRVGNAANLSKYFNDPSFAKRYNEAAGSTDEVANLKGRIATESAGIKNRADADENDPASDYSREYLRQANEALGLTGDKAIAPGSMSAAQARRVVDLPKFAQTESNKMQMGSLKMAYQKIMNDDKLSSDEKLARLKALNDRAIAQGHDETSIAVGAGHDQATIDAAKIGSNTKVLTTGMGLTESDGAGGAGGGGGGGNLNREMDIRDRQVPFGRWTNDDFPPTKKDVNDSKEFMKYADQYGSAIDRLSALARDPKAMTMMPGSEIRKLIGAAAMAAQQANTKARGNGVANGHDIENAAKELGGIDSGSDLLHWMKGDTWKALSAARQGLEQSKAMVLKDYKIDYGQTDLDQVNRFLKKHGFGDGAGGGGGGSRGGSGSKRPVNGDLARGASEKAADALGLGGGVPGAQNLPLSGPPQKPKPIGTAIDQTTTRVVGGKTYVRGPNGGWVRQGG